MSQGTTTVSAIVRQAAACCPGRAAVVSPDGQARTYRELLDRSHRLAVGFLGLGLRQGDRVATWMDDSVAYIEVYVACALAGLVVVPVNARFTEHEARQVLDDAQADTLVFSPSLDERVGALIASEASVATVGSGASPFAQHTLDALATADPRVVLAHPSPQDLFIIGYTSGTTGRPKGAMLTQGSVATLARMNTVSYRMPVGGIAALTGSMSFVATVPAHIISHFYVRGTVCLLGRWDVESLLAAVGRHQATFTYIPSPLLGDFTDAAAANPRRWQSLQTVLHSASKAPPGKLRRLADVVGYRLVEGWGMTENSGGLVTATTPADAWSAPGGVDRLGTVGQAVPEVLVAVVGPDGRRLPHDGETLGELAVRSPALMAGYWQRPEISAAVLRDGWYHTGDLGTIDADGYVRISERRVDLIVSGGMNVYPTEVEECILRLPGVAACVVVGVPHERWGQTVVAAVVRDAQATVSESEVTGHCRRFLASYKKPTRVVFVDSLPTTSSLKVSRQAVRELLS